MSTEDPHVRAAIGHWAPRFITNGVDYSDFQRTTERVQRWADWSHEWSRTAEIHEALAREAEERGAAASAAEAYLRAALCHHFGKFVYFEDMDQYRRASAATSANYRKAAANLDPPTELVSIPYGGAALPGNLRLPRGVTRPPVVLIFSGLDSVKEEAHTLEAVLHRRGLATLAFDGPGQGESEAMPFEPAFEKVATAVADWLGTRDDIDSGRIGVIGISLGSYFAARAAAFEPRMTCSVSFGGRYSYGNFDSMPAISQQAFQTRTHSPDKETARERTKAFTLAETARHIRSPFLIVYGGKDRLVPREQAERLFAEIPGPDKTFKVFEEGNHVCNNMPYASRPFVADWLVAKLGAAAARNA